MRSVMIAALMLILFMPVCTAAAQMHEVDGEAAEAFAKLVESYRQRDGYTVKSVVEIEVKDGDTASNKQKKTAELYVRKDGPGKFTVDGFTCHLQDGQIFAVHDSTDHSYYSKEDDDSPFYALLTMFIDLPFPHLALAWGEPDMDSVYMQFHQKSPWVVPTSVTDVEEDGKTRQQIQLTSEYSSVTITVDPETKLMTGVTSEITGGDLVQGGASIVYTHTFEYADLDNGPDAATLRFDPGQRQRSDSLFALIDRPDQVAGGGGGGGLVGQPAPDFVLATLDGDAIDLADLEGHVVVLDFWATWCPPCRAAMPSLQEVADWTRAEALPVTVLTINSFESRALQQDTPEARLESAKNYWNAEGFTMSVAMDYSDQVAMEYGVNAIPATFIIRSDGVVHSQGPFRPDMLVETLKAEIQAAIEALEGPADNDIEAHDHDHADDEAHAHPRHSS